MTDKIVVLSTAPSQAEATRLARHLLTRRVAACVNILPGARSVYRWKGAVEEAEEHVLVIKSRRDLFDSLQRELASLHTYEVPEVVALPIIAGSESYLSWLDGELGPEA
ncbi:MAG: divalent-cation tolerance protein CutA [Bryobacter sp.]|jgi:periplasmic divalent cation tolerance protein|nr:divalent-cation tolerance protein CutA [Bryobacter sp.]